MVSLETRISVCEDSSGDGSTLGSNYLLRGVIITKMDIIKAVLKWILLFVR